MIARIYLVVTKGAFNLFILAGGGTINMVNNTGDGIGEHGNEGPSAGTLEEHGGTNNQSDNYRNAVHGVALALEIGKFYFALHDDSNNQGHDSSCIHA